MEDRIEYSDKGASNESEPSPTGDLKNLLAIMQSDTSGQSVPDFRKEIGRLKQTRRMDTVPLFLLSMLDSVGGYMEAEKGLANPDCPALLASILDGLEWSLGPARLNETEKEKILLNKVQEYNRLKARIDLEKNALESKMPQAPVKEEVETGSDHGLTAHVMDADLELGGQTAAAPHGVDVTKESGATPISDNKPTPAIEGDTTPEEIFRSALDELKRTVRNEFIALKKELALWKN